MGNAASQGSIKIPGLKIPVGRSFDETINKLANARRALLHQPVWSLRWEQQKLIFTGGQCHLVDLPSSLTAEKQRAGGVLISDEQRNATASVASEVVRGLRHNNLHGSDPHRELNAREQHVLNKIITEIPPLVNQLSSNGRAVGDLIALSEMREILFKQKHEAAAAKGHLGILRVSKVEVRCHRKDIIYAVLCAVFSNLGIGPGGFFLVPAQHVTYDADGNLSSTTYVMQIQMNPIGTEFAFRGAWEAVKKWNSLFRS